MDIDVGARVAEIRADVKMNKREFAEMLGISDTVISNVESGVREPSKELLLSISIKCAISLNWLYLGVGEKSLVSAIKTVSKEHPVIQALESMIMDKTAQYSRALTQIDERITALENKQDKGETGCEEHSQNKP